MLPFTSPAGYGLGKSGWVTAELEPGQEPVVELFERWIDESYRAQAPKKLVKQLDERAARTEQKPNQGLPAKRKNKASGS
jgi:hypothetical protein